MIFDILFLTMGLNLVFSSFPFMPTFYPFHCSWDLSFICADFDDWISFFRCTSFEINHHWTCLWFQKCSFYVWICSTYIQEKSLDFLVHELIPVGVSKLLSSRYLSPLLSASFKGKIFIFTWCWLADKSLSLVTPKSYSLAISTSLGTSENTSSKNSLFYSSNWCSIFFLINCWKLNCGYVKPLCYTLKIKYNVLLTQQEF